MPDYRFHETARACVGCGFKSQPGTERCPQCGSTNLQPVGKLGEAPTKVRPARSSGGGARPRSAPADPQGPTQPIAPESGRPGFLQRLTASLRPPPPPRAKFASQIRRSPSFNALTRDGSWVCPYCGKTPGRIGHGPAREEAILRHLADVCPSYQPDRKPMSPKELKDRARVLNIKVEAARLVETHPMWKYRDLEGALICPFCAENTEAQFPPNVPPPDASLDTLSEHLARCPEYSPGRGYGQAPAALEERKSWSDEVVRVKRVARTCATKNPEWMVWDEGDNWFCCFCAQGTDVHLPEGSPLTEGTIREMGLHLADCEAYGRGRGEPKPLAELETAMDRWNRDRRVMKELTTRVAVLANWQRIERYGHWLCPYCDGKIFKVAPAERELIADTLPPKILEHLTQSCDVFRAGLLAQPSEGEPEDRLIPLIRALG